MMRARLAEAIGRQWSVALHDLARLLIATKGKAGAQLWVQALMDEVEK